MTMILYHTSDREIQNPDIHIGRKNADFGWGFYLTPEEALRILAIGPEYSQIAVKTEKAAKKLRFIRSEKIEKADETARQKEQDAFQEDFAREIEEIMKA